MDLSHWDLVDEFLLNEVASLAAGVDPQERTVPAELKGKWELLRRVLSQAYDSAVSNASFYLSGGPPFCDDQKTIDRHILQSGNLPSIELTKAVHRCMAQGSDWQEEFMMVESDLSVTFDRQTLAEWFQAKGYKPAYSWLRLSEPEGAAATGGQPSAVPPLAEPTGALRQRTESTYRNIVGALLECIMGKLPGVEKHPSFDSEAKLIEKIAQRYDGIDGLSKRNLEKYFAAAKRNLSAA